MRTVAQAGAIPLIMSYWNLIFHYGVERFAAEFEAAGGAGLITPDLIPDEAGGWIEASQRQLGVPVDLAIVAEDVGSYKPALGHWERFFEATTADRDHHVHVAASLFHDIAPGRELGLRTVWINRLEEHPEPKPDRELTDLSKLPDTLEELVPA